MYPQTLVILICIHSDKILQTLLLCMSLPTAKLQCIKCLHWALFPWHQLPGDHAHGVHAHSWGSLNPFTCITLKNEEDLLGTLEVDNFTGLTLLQ